MTPFDKVRQPVESKLKDMGFELFDFRFFQAGSRSILRIVIDSPDGVTIEDCEHVSNEVSVVLDVEGFMGGKGYNLEISSPGIDRPLKTERDYNRIKGRPVVLHCHEGVQGEKTIRGEVIECKDNIVTLKNEQSTVSVPLSDIYSGKEEIRFK